MVKRNRFKELDLVDRVPEALWTEVPNIVLEMVTKTISKKKKCKKVKWLSEEVLLIAEERRDAKGKSKRETYTQVNAKFQRIARRYKKTFLSEQWGTEENNRMGKTRDLFKKIRYQGNISCKDGYNKGQKRYGPNRTRRY